MALLGWANNSGELDRDEVWVLAQAYASVEVRRIVNSYLAASESEDKETEEYSESEEEEQRRQDKLRQDLGEAIRRDLRTNTKLT